MKLKDILDEGKATLTKNKIDDADFDATEILLSLLDMDMATFLYECESDLEDKFSTSSISRLISDFDDMIDARAKHYPLQYLLGESYFCGMRFKLNDGVLIPRSDTETLVEKVLFDNVDKNKYVLDLCTGSGCIAIALSKLGDYKIVVGTDISDEAINVAASNAEELIDDSVVSDEMMKKIYFLKSDLFSSFDKLRNELGISSFDIITANPPYIRRGELNKLQDEVSEYEPRLALDGDVDGLKYYREIAKGARPFLNPGGKIYLEIGFDQADDVKKIFEESGYTHIETVKDLGGNDRVIIFI